MIWPALILVSWFAIKIALSYYEKKYSESQDNETRSQAG